MTRNNTLNQP